MGQIQLNGMTFYAYHGCYSEEQLKGNQFLVDITMDTDLSKASESDELNDTLNYAEVYEIVKQEMSIQSQLLEHLSRRILDKLFERFPQLDEASVCVAKMHPPVGGEMQSVSVRQKRVRKEKRVKR